MPIRVITIEGMGQQGSVGPPGNAGTSTAPTYTKAAMLALPTPTAGDLVRVTDDIRGLWMYTGTHWKSVTGLADAHDFGAIGDAGTDDTVAIQAAIDAAAATFGASVWIPEGSYLISAVLIVPEGVTIQGAGGYVFHYLRGTTLQTAVGYNGDIFQGETVDDPTTYWSHGVRIESLALRGRRATGQTAGSGIRMCMGEGAVIRDVVGINFPESVVRLQKALAPARIYNLVAYESQYGLSWDTAPLGGVLDVYGITGDGNDSLVNIECDSTDPVTAGGPLVNVNLYGLKAEQSPVSGVNDPVVRWHNANGGTLNIHGGFVLNQHGTTGTGTQAIVGVTGSSGRVNFVSPITHAGYGRIYNDAVTGETITASRGSDAGETTSYKGEHPAPKCKVHRSSVYSLANGSNDAIPFNAVDYDYLDMFTVNDDHLTVREGWGGEWLVIGQVAFNSGGGTRRAAQLNRDSEVLALDEVTPNASTFTRLNLSFSERLDPGDEIKLFAYQDSGGALDLAATNTFLKCYRIGS